MSSGRSLPAGVVPPLVTPFTATGDIDERAYQKNFETYAAHDLAGYLVLGSNGEATSLAEDEKLALIRLTRKAAGTRTVLAGTGLESTRATIDFTRKAADAGADIALVVTPFYFKGQMTAAALTAHYAAVAEAAPIPVMLYTVPVFTGIAFPPELIASVGAHRNVVGMKESSGDMTLMARLTASAPPTFKVACGSATVLYPALCMGAHAGIIALACCAPAISVSLFKAWSAGNHELARKIQAAVTPLAIAVTGTYGVAGLKRAMDLAGMQGGAVRSPLLPAQPDIDAVLRRLLDEANASSS